MKRRRPFSLGARVFAVLLLVIVGTDAAALYFHCAFRSEAAAVGAATQAAEQIIAIRRMLEQVPNPRERKAVIARFNSPMMRMTLDLEPVVAVSDDQLPTRVFLKRMRGQFPPDAEIRVDSLFDARAFDPLPFTENIDQITSSPEETTLAKAPTASDAVPSLHLVSSVIRPAGQRFGGALPIVDNAMFRVSIKDPNGERWFNARILVNLAEPADPTTFIIWLTAASLLITGVALLGLRRATAPLSVFATAAERLGVDVNAEPLREKGPPEVERAARAFNTMQKRVKRFIQDRTQMLAAISHDLRTPITRLRLRAEFVEDDQQRRKMLNDLEEMEAMIAETLVFARDDAANEPASHVDVAAVVASLCGDLRAADRDVTYQGPDSFDLLTRPLALKRSLNNLIDNGLKYGKSVRVSLTPLEEEVRILVDDDGPGVPEADRERAFQPFVRLEGSRSRETGGAGLGLTIARNAIRSMGGDVELTNRPEGGLRATVSLPIASAALVPGKD